MRRTTRGAAVAAVSAAILLAGCADDAGTGETEPGVDDPATGEMVEDLEGLDPTTEPSEG